MAAVERSASSGNPASSRPPPLTQTDAITSLLSLSLAAAGAAIAPSTTGSTGDTDGTSALDTETTSIPGIPSINGAANLTTSTTPIAPAVAATSSSTGKHHRRLGSTGKTRRRLSDAREASARPILVPAATSSAALSLASLSLSTSPPSGHSHSNSLSQSMQSLGNGYLGHGSLPSYSYSQGYAYQGVPITSGSRPNGGAVPIPISNAGLASSEDAKSQGANGSLATDGNESVGKSPMPIAISSSASGKTKKRGVDYRCESCSKIYRHPNCLNKHRWEHTRQWREASKFVLSKHQQVQLLEAAAILSFMGTTSTSLPDDRSEWPSFLSGGSLPKTEPVGATGTANASIAAQDYPSVPVTTSGLGQSHYAPQQVQASSVSTSRTTTHPIYPHPVSSSVPNVSSGPRMHDYALPESGQSAKVTQVRPGLLGVPTNPAVGTHTTTTTLDGYETPTAAPTGENGWSLPNSSLRSDSYVSSRRSASRSRSRSGSASRSDESLDIEVDVDGMDAEVDVRVASANSAIRGSYTGYPAYSTISTTPGLSHSPGYGYLGHGHTAGYGYGHGHGHGYSGRRGIGMKREEDEMSVGFSVREEDEEEEDGAADMKGKEDSKWNGMEMEVDMDMD